MARLEDPIDLEAFQQLSLDGGPMNYPENIIQDINTAIADIAYVYIMPDRDLNDKAPKVLRTKFTPWSAAPFNRPFPGISDTDCDPELPYHETYDRNHGFLVSVAEVFVETV